MLGFALFLQNGGFIHVHCCRHTQLFLLNRFPVGIQFLRLPLSFHTISCILLNASLLPPVYSFPTRDTGVSPATDHSCICHYLSAFTELPSSHVHIFALRQLPNLPAITSIPLQSTKLIVHLFLISIWCSMA